MRLDRTTGVLGLAVGVVLSGLAWAQPAPTQAAPATAQEVMPSHPRPQPAKKASEPGSQEHKILEGFAGHWNATVHVMASSATPAAQDSKGTADGKLLLDGKFAQLTHTGVLNGKPYEAVMLFGFDNAFSKYTGIWMDTTSPAFISYVGAYDASKKQITMKAHYSDQFVRKFTVSRAVVTFVDADTLVIEVYQGHADPGPDVLVRTITYKRG